MSALPQMMGQPFPPAMNPLDGFGAPSPESATPNYGVDDDDTEETVECFHPDADCADQERRDEVANRLFATFSDFKNSTQRSEAERMWRAAERLYYGYKETNSPHEIIIRECWRQVQTWVTQVAKGLTAGEVLFKAEPRVEGFDDQAEGATAVIHDQLKRSGSRQQMDMYLKCICLYGNAYMAPGYRRFKRCAYKMTSLHADTEADWWDKETSEVYENLPFLEHLSCWDVYCHPKVELAKNSPHVFIVKEVSPDGLKTLIREGWIDADATRLAVESGQSGKSAQNVRGDTLWDDDLSFLSEDNRPHELIICWSIDGWEHVILDNQFLLRAMPLPDGEIPIISDRYDAMPDKHYSMGLPIIIADEQRVVNQIVSYKLGNLGFDCNPVVLCARGTDAKKNWDRGVIKPGVAVEVGAATDITYLQRPNAQGPASEEVAFWQEHQREQTGITDRLSGSGPNTGTATGASQLSNAASERLENTVRMLTPGFEQMYRWMYNLNARNNDQVYTMRVAGVDGGNVFARYTPEIFKPDVDVNVEVGGGVSPQAAMTWANNIKTIGQVPGMDVLAMADELLKASGVTRVKKFHTSSANSQGDALAENQQVQLIGIVAEPKAGDNHQMHVQIHQMLLSNQAVLMALPPAFVQALQAHLAVHMQYLQQMQQANAQMQQASMPAMGGGQGPNGGPTAVQSQANGAANQNFNMAGVGAAQNGGVAA